MRPFFCNLLLAGFILFIAVQPAMADGEDMTVDSHGMLLDCDDKTRENHLFLMNAEKLGLSAEQIRQLREIKGDCDKVCIADKVKLRVAKVELTEILNSKEMDMELANEKIRQISALQDRLRVRHLKTRVKSMMVLNEEQKKKARSLER